MELELSSLDADTDADRLRRAEMHRALGDPRRLAIVDALHLGDLAPSRLAELTGLSSNLLAFHLNVLEQAGVVERAVSEGDARRRYVRLRLEVLGASHPVGAGTLSIVDGAVVFVCTHNSARSQLAAALWERQTGQPARSAGNAPATAVHPLAIEVASAHGLDLSGASPRSFTDLGDLRPELVVSVCDRVAETRLPFDAPTLHWSVPDPVGGNRRRFEDAYLLLESRVEVLATSLAA